MTLIPWKSCRGFFHKKCFKIRTVSGPSSFDPVVVPSASKSMPEDTLGIQFNGNASSFIERVEVSSARNVSRIDLFHSASHLFIDKATFWLKAD